jgi:hypothetical protein
MYEAILGATVRDIYRGLFAEANDTVRARARGLCASLERGPKTLRRDRKIAILKTIINEEVTSTRS